MRGTEDGAIVRLRGRAQTYGVIAGVVAGMLIAGLLVPMALGDSATTSVASNGRTADALGSGADTAETTTTSAAPSDTSASRPSAAPVSGGAAVTAAPTSGGAPLTASDKGVSATSIKVGFVLLDLTTAHTVGLA